MKRKVITAILHVVCILMIPVCAFATSGLNTYVLDELGLTVAISADEVVFTRDLQDNDPNLTAYGLEKESLLSLFTTNNIYLNAWAPDIHYEIVVTMVENTIENFNTFNDGYLKIIAAALPAEYEKYGWTVTDTEIYPHEQAKFIKLYVTQPEGEGFTYVLQYYTIFNSKAINLSIRSYDGEIDANDEEVIKTIVDSAQFAM